MYINIYWDEDVIIFQAVSLPAHSLLCGAITTSLRGTKHLFITVTSNTTDGEP